MTKKSIGKNLILEVLKSLAFSKSVSEANVQAQNKTGILGVLKKALEKANNLGIGGVFNIIRNKVLVIGRLLKAYTSNEYRDLSIKNVVILTAGLIYFISPIDFIPDFLPILGFADDLVLLNYVLESIGEELEKFELWEKNKV